LVVAVGTVRELGWAKDEEGKELDNDSRADDDRG
jgi:hypothetical protein